MTRAKSVPLGPLSHRSSGSGHFMPAPASFPTPTRVTNSMMPTAEPGQITRLMTATVRPGALSFMECRSRGTGC
jgi:hypothetical protein